MPINSISPSSSYSDRSPVTYPVLKNYLGMLSQISDAFPHKTAPSYRRGAMQGEGVYAAYNSKSHENYLYSLNAQTCVISTLYNKRNKMGAIIHFDHNIRSHINHAISTALQKICATESTTNASIQATLAGGIWFMGGTEIGAPVKHALLKHGINPSWDHWSFSPCIEHNYGVVLDLSQGGVQVFEHSLDTVERFMAPLLSQTLHKIEKTDFHLSPEQQRAHTYIKRFKSPAIAEDEHGKFYFTQMPSNQRKVTEPQVRQQYIPIHNIDTLFAAHSKRR